MTALLWFRRDLRLHDHPALHAAMEQHERVLPVFCLDDRLLAGRHASGPRTRFLLECLHDLARGLGERGAALVVRRGRPEQVLVELARAVGADAVYCTQGVTPFARQRGGAVAEALSAAGIEHHVEPGLAVTDGFAGLRTQAGKPYTVFTPFYRSWDTLPRRKPLAAPHRIAMAEGVDAGTLPTPEDLGATEQAPNAQQGGESAAEARLAWFLDGPVRDYEEAHDRMDIDGTSKLSAYLHFGCLSPRAVEARLPHDEGGTALRRQLCWRDFYHYVQLHFPQNARAEFQERYRGRLSWPGDDALLSAWKAGQTGFPLVDAGMRQLLREGWMHNRARLLTASFLTKQLGVDWRAGESWFMRMLIDGDQANNNGNWQWTASVGVDPAPVFRRLYNPTLHQRRYDPEGRYVR